MSTPNRPDPPRPWSRSLLDAVVADSLEPSYQAFARRKAESADVPPSARARLLTVGGMLLVGLVAVPALLAANQRDYPAASTRSSLTAEVTKRTAETSVLRQRVAALRAEVAQRRQEALLVPGSGEDGKNLADTVGELQASAGFAPVSGRGIEVKIDDAAVAGAADALNPRDGDANSQVTDRDLQGVVNELWAAGAEAVSVGDYRLTSVSAIRAAGEAILVDYKPLLRPYVVRAIGDPDKLNDAVNSGAAGQRLRFLRETAGVTVSIEKEARMDLPSAQEVALRYATSFDAESTSAPASKTGTP